MNDVVSRIQRELPDTDKDRYDVAYERGRAQARSGLLFGGLVAGALTGLAAMFLLDPDRGTGRRAQLASRATGIRNDLARIASGRLEDLQNRAKGAAIESGIRDPEDFEDRPSQDRAVGVMDRPLGEGTPSDSVNRPITPEEVERHGAGGPVGGAAAEWEDQRA